jgi:signal transduction histidine kinase
VAALQNLREAPSFEPWRTAALERGYRSVASVPVTYGGTLYCVLNLYADRPFAFDESEQELLSEVGEDVGRTLGGLEARRELELVNRVLRHDIRNDMNVVLGWTDLLADHVDEAGQDHLRRIETTSRHVVELTDVSRDLLSAVVGTSEPNLEPVDLAAVAEEETTKARESYGEATFTVDRPLESGPVRGNQMLSSVVRNLLNNAVQHNDAPTPHVHVATEVDHDDGVVRLRVADNGPGIPESRREAIFGKGERGLDSEGTGMGLYLVGALVEAFDGRVDVEDSGLGGAAFVVELPAWEP